MIENIIQLGSTTFDCWKAAKILLGDGYKTKIDWYILYIKKCQSKNKLHNPIQTVDWIIDNVGSVKHDGLMIVFLMAAMAEIIGTYSDE